eukprot:CAMPEP_0197671130 /NCGR_PEP_ID=MMETSP1338-20131121/76046_1 /TAXON_ID=43686 ORGANISM="Pelagodinium beii, Strain RCC1491" /NCGR_SAMPLE_ID=MMETSP1338 /ASSEMBLY_ACC=CAM_ASM_000754 /LENGTH=47 /DNA_ID= /DNA_START= /DNA_END= /DNA_ORIENTATION=
MSLVLTRCKSLCKLTAGIKASVSMIRSEESCLTRKELNQHVACVSML